MALQRLGLFIAGAALAAVPVLADPLPPDASYRPLPTLPFGAVKANDEAAKPAVMQRQQTLLEQRYDLGDRPIPGQMMSGARKPVQGGVCSATIKKPRCATIKMTAGRKTMQLTVASALDSPIRANLSKAWPFRPPPPGGSGLD